MLFVLVIRDGCKAREILSNHGKMHKALCERIKNELQLNIMVIGPSGLHFDLWSHEWLTKSGVTLQMSDYSKLSDYNWTEWLVKNKAAQAANAPIIFEEAVMIIKIHSENFNVLFYKRSLLNPSNILIIRSLLQMLNKYCTQSVNVIFTLAFYEHLRVAFY